jgi:hypothetical protein
VAVAKPQRPVSSAGLDGASVVVSAPVRRVNVAIPLAIDDIAAAHVAAEVTATTALERTPAVADADPQGAVADLEVRADRPAEVGLIEGIIGAVIGFLFG